METASVCSRLSFFFCFASINMVGLPPTRQRWMTGHFARSHPEVLNRVFFFHRVRNCVRWRHLYRKTAWRRQLSSCVVLQEQRRLWCHSSLNPLVWKHTWRSTWVFMSVSQLSLKSQPQKAVYLGATMGTLQPRIRFWDSNTKKLRLYFFFGTTKTWCDCQGWSV